MRSCCFLLALAAASPAFAQAPPPAIDNRIPIVVVDARGVFARLGQDPITATGLFLDPIYLPAKAFGLSGGAHIYPVRGRGWALGIGAEAITARAKFEPIDTTTLEPTGDVYKRRLRGVSGQVSLNFGHKLGWSYLTVGAGPLAFESYKEVSATAPTAATMPDGLRARTVNFGGGARWFNVAHLAFTVDLRFYLTPAALATPNTAPRDKHKVFVMSAGIAIK